MLHIWKEISKCGKIVTTFLMRWIFKFGAPYDCALTDQTHSSFLSQSKHMLPCCCCCVTWVNKGLTERKKLLKLKLRYLPFSGSRSIIILQVVESITLRCYQPSEAKVTLRVRRGGVIYCPGHHCSNNTGTIWFKVKYRDRHSNIIKLFVIDRTLLQILCFLSQSNL